MHHPHAPPRLVLAVRVELHRVEAHPRLVTVLLRHIRAVVAVVRRRSAHLDRPLRKSPEPRHRHHHRRRSARPAPVEVVRRVPTLVDVRHRRQILQLRFGRGIERRRRRTNDQLTGHQIELPLLRRARQRVRDPRDARDLPQRRRQARVQTLQHARRSVAPHLHQLLRTQARLHAAHVGTHVHQASIQPFDLQHVPLDVGPRHRKRLARREVHEVRTLLGQVPGQVPGHHQRRVARPPQHTRGIRGSRKLHHVATHRLHLHRSAKLQAPRSASRRHLRRQHVNPREPAPVRRPHRLRIRLVRLRPAQLPHLPVLHQQQPRSSIPPPHVRGDHRPGRSGVVDEGVEVLLETLDHGDRGGRNRRLRHAGGAEQRDGQGQRSKQLEGSGSQCHRGTS